MLSARLAVTHDTAIHASIPPVPRYAVAAQAGVCQLPDQSTTAAPASLVAHSICRPARQRKHSQQVPVATAHWWRRLRWSADATFGLQRAGTLNECPGGSRPSWPNMRHEKCAQSSSSRSLQGEAAAGPDAPNSHSGTCAKLHSKLAMVGCQTKYRKSSRQLCHAAMQCHVQGPEAQS